ANSQNAVARFDVTKGKLVYVYKVDSAKDPETNQPTRERNTLALSIGYDSSASGVSPAESVNWMENHVVFYDNYVGNLWLKAGANATYATINLFSEDADNNGKADELETIIENNWLINQAVLTLYVDQTAVGKDTLTYPNRLYLYDFTHNTPLTDY